MKNLVRIVLMTFALSLVAPALSLNDLHAQCAMCKLNAENGVTSKQRKVGTGLNTGILLLLTMPYAVVGTVGVLWYQNSKSLKKKRLALNN